MAKVPEALVKALIAGQWSDASDRRMALEIARRESQFDTTAHNTAGRDNSYGLFQINMKDDLGTRRRQRYQLPTNEVLYDPSVNVAVARRVWEDNGRSFGGSAGWSTSASAAAAITGSDDDGDDDAMRTTIATKIKKAIDDGKLPDGDITEYVILVVNDVRGSDGRPGSAEIIAAAGLTDAEVSFLREGTSTGVGDLSPIGGPDLSGLDPLGAIQAVASKLLDPTFWKRIGIGVLSFLIILIAVVFYNKDAIATVASKGTVNDV